MTKKHNNVDEFAVLLATLRGLNRTNDKNYWSSGQAFWDWQTIQAWLDREADNGTQD